MSGSAKSFELGVTAFRNSREWAMEKKRDELIAAVNARK